MLPSYKIVIGAVLLSIILFAMSGAGVVMPETYTRIGEMPEVSRPMMQRMITDEAGQARFHILSLARRTEELGRLRELAALDVGSEPAAAPATDKPLSLEPAVVQNPEPDAVTVPILATAKSAMAPAAVPDEHSGVSGLDSGQVSAAAGGREPPMVAVLPAPPDAVVRSEALPSDQVRLPRQRPAARTAASMPRRPVHRPRRFALTPPTDLGLFGPSSFQSR